MKKKELFAGIGMGALIGIIIGLSISEVTGIILGALTSLLTTFLGLKEKKENEESNHFIIGVFGLSCLFFILIGMYARTNNLIGQSIEKQKKELIELGFNQAEIKAIIMVREFGIIKEGYTFSENAIDKKDKGILMADENNKLTLCDEINENSSLDDIKKSFDNCGGKYQLLQQGVSETVQDSTQLRKILLIIKTAICNEN